MTKDFWDGYVPEPVKPAQQCKWPTCQSEEYQQALAEQIKRELVGEQPAQQEPEHIVRSNGRHSPLLTHMMNKRVKSNLKQVIELYDSPEQPAQQEPVACKTLCELCAKRGYSGCANAAQITPIPSPPAQQGPVQVSPLEFVTMTLEKEHLVGRPIIWAQWPNKENT